VMDQISVLIESMCSIRDDDLRLIERKEVESYKNLPQMVFGPSGSDCAERRTHDRRCFPRPGAVPMGPRGPIDRVLQDSRDGVVVLGRCDQKASALRMRFFSSSTDDGGPFSSSSLNNTGISSS